MQYRITSFNFHYKYLCNLKSNISIRMLKNARKFSCPCRVQTGCDSITCNSSTCDSPFTYYKFYLLYSNRKPFYLNLKDTLVND